VPLSDNGQIAHQSGLRYGQSWPNTSAALAPRCNGYLWIVLREPGNNTPLRAVNGHCLGCGYRLAWIVFRGKRDSARGLERERGLSKNGNKIVTARFSLG
jgi:hypothetical protein